MAVTAAPGARRSLLGIAVDAVAGRARRKGRVSKLAAAVNDHLLTVCALGAGVADGFLHGPTVGLAVLVPALLVLDFKIQG